MVTSKVKLSESHLHLKPSLMRVVIRDESQHLSNATEVPPSNTLTRCCLCTSATTSLRADTVLLQSYLNLEDNL